MSVPVTLLLVDDDADDREIFLLALSKISSHDVRCITAQDGPNALCRLASGDVVPDIIFLDLNMPIMNGHQVLQKLKSDASTRDIPVVILSTASDPLSIAQARQAGASCFYTKPVKMADWGTMLDTALAVINSSRRLHSAPAQ